MKDFFDICKLMEKLERDGMVCRKVKDDQIIWDLTPQARKQAEQWAKELGL